MARRNLRLLVLVAASFLILLIATISGYFIAEKLVVSGSKYPGFHINYLPEKTTKLETAFISRSSIHFRGESGKLYGCDHGKKKCAAVLQVPKRYDGKTPFVESVGIYAKFSPPPSKPVQIVFRRNRGLVGHQTATQYALLEDGRVWYWIRSGNEMGDSFPFWHLNNWLPLTVGSGIGLIIGFFISVVMWLVFYRKR